MSITIRKSTAEREEEVLRQFIAAHGIRNSTSRNIILRVFLSTERHVSTAELHALIRRRHAGIGIATVYRTMKLLTAAGLAREVDFGDGTARYEHTYGHEHHDHLICLKCGSFVEAVDPRIEELQKELADQHGFAPVNHSLRIFGICRECRGDRARI